MRNVIWFFLLSATILMIGWGFHNGSVTSNNLVLVGVLSFLSLWKVYDVIYGLPIELIGHVVQPEDKGIRAFVLLCSVIIYGCLISVVL